MGGPNGGAGEMERPGRPPGMGGHDARYLKQNWALSMGGPNGRFGRAKRPGKAPGMGGQSARNLEQSQDEEEAVPRMVEEYQMARNLEESQVVEEVAARDRRKVTERVWQHLASVPCMDHEHTEPVIVPQTVATWEPNTEYVPAKEAYLTTGGDYGRFPRGAEFLGRPCVSHSLNTRFTHHLAASGMYRNHSLNT
ncbi:uncharacterized protein LOC135210052 [Macrobrachium nipponense]|uniref:uncharacterized protein LOC135210052 n=1 Tax=Macrobrachium nipponense TaxID=159736 RepID=UPI0030C82238